MSATLQLYIDRIHEMKEQGMQVAPCPHCKGHGRIPTCCTSKNYNTIANEQRFSDYMLVPGHKHIWSMCVWCNGSGMINMDLVEEYFITHWSSFIIEAAVAINQMSDYMEREYHS